MSLLHDLIVATGLGRHDLRRIIDTAPSRYKVYYIAKKGGGQRQIAHPSQELKIIQRIILDKYLVRFPVHPSATAYVRGINIIDNARMHVAGRAVLKMDFESFFPSIRALDWKLYLLALDECAFVPEDIDLVTRILFWGRGKSGPRCLSIGAPTSPMVSNIMLFDLDKRISALATEYRVSYSRYADDMTFSASAAEQLLRFETLVRREVGKTSHPRLKFNESKRGLYTKSQRRMVTGLVITPTGRVSIGRGRKRTIAAMLHRFSLGDLDIEEVGVLKGLLGFALANEPDFVGRMRTKYGGNIVSEVLRTYIPTRKERQINDEIA